MLAKKQWVEWLWDGWCIISGIGIWPRYIEPCLLEATYLTLSISQLPIEFVGLKILHFSDLHWSAQFSSLQLKKLINKVNAFEPDFIFFTGDFLCRSQLEEPEKLKKLLCSLKAKKSCFAIFGNHDYARFVTVNSDGDYDVERSTENPTIVKGFKRLFQSVDLTTQVTKEAQEVGMHQELVKLVADTPFQLLNNETQLVAYKGSRINICGLGEYSLGKFHPDQAFKNFNSDYPGIVLSHNPDTVEILKKYPGDIILSGHTHGGQVNLPGIWKRFTKMKYPQFKRGLKLLDNKKWVYVNRGISGVMKFRWFSIPELTLMTLQ